MRGVFGILGLVIVAAIVGLLAKKQLNAVAPAAASSPSGQPTAAAPQQQVQQVRQAAEAALQSPRAVDDTR